MALDRSTGAQVSEDGRKFEELVRDACEDAGYIAKTQHRFYQSRNLYGGVLVVDVFISPNQRFPRGLVIECSRQNVKGSGDHKIPHKILTAIVCNPCESIIILDGEGFTKGAVKWARERVGYDWVKLGDYTKLLGVFTLFEFLEWIGLSSDWLIQRQISGKKPNDMFAKSRNTVL